MHNICAISAAAEHRQSSDITRQKLRCGIKMQHARSAGLVTRFCITSLPKRDVDGLQPIPVSLTLECLSSQWPRVGGHDVKMRFLSHNVLPSHFSSLIESVKSFFR